MESTYSQAISTPALTATRAKVTKLEVGQEGVEHFRKLQETRIKKVAEIFKLPIKEEAKMAPKAPSAAPHTAMAEAADTVQKDSIPAPAPALPSLEKIIKAAERHFGIDRRILLNRRANEGSIVSARACVFRVAVDDLKMTVDAVGAALIFSDSQVERELNHFREQCKNADGRMARKYAAFRNRF